MKLNTIYNRAHDTLAMFFFIIRSIFNGKIRSVPHNTGYTVYQKKKKKYRTTTNHHHKCWYSLICFYECNKTIIIGIVHIMGDTWWTRKGQRP